MTIADTLFTKTQQRILALLYSKPGQSYFLNELVRLADVGKGAIKRELDQFCAVDLLSMTRQGNQTFYQANIDHPLFNELTSITHKTLGMFEQLHSVLRPLTDRITSAFIYGQAAEEVRPSLDDIDLLIVADSLTYRQLMALLTVIENTLDRTINLTLYSEKEFRQRCQNDHYFIEQIMGQRHYCLIADKSIKAAKVEITIMDSPPVEQWLSTGDLLAEAPKKVDIEQLLITANIKLHDVELSGLSLDSQFSLVYQAAYLISLAALRHHGYRPVNYDIAFQWLKHTIIIDQAQYRVLQKSMKLDATVQLTGYLNIDQNFYIALQEVTLELLSSVKILVDVQLN